MIRLKNNTGLPWRGWKRLNADDGDLTAFQASFRTDDGQTVIAGNPSSLDTRHIDVHCDLQPGEEIEISAASYRQPITFVRGAIPDSLTNHGPMVGGVPLIFKSVEANGAGFDVHLTCRVTPMLHANVWLTYYPDQPSRCRGVIGLTASNVGIPALIANIPDNLTLDIPGAIVKVEGLSYGQPLRPAHSSMADGQARLIPFLVVWPEHLKNEIDFQSAVAEMTVIGICGNAIEKLWPMGNPRMDPTDDAAEWVRTKWPPTLQRMHTWLAGPEGVDARSGDTGAQADQLFVGAECMAPGGLGAEAVLYLTALGQARRPCHHLEANGELLDFAGHPDLVIWDARAHYRSDVSRDRLGKGVGTISLVDTNGWWGPDEEHWLINTLAISARISGCPALQWLLEAHARLFYFQKTTAPNVSTSRPGAARATGWEAIGAVHLYRGLKNRDTADLVRRRWHDRVNMVLLPQLGSRVADVWHAINDPRWQRETGTSGADLNWSPYQQSLGAWGLHFACSTIGPEAGIELAMRGARAVHSRAFDEQGRGWATIQLRGTEIVPLVEGHGASFGPNVTIWHKPMLSLLPEAEVVRRLYDADFGDFGKWSVPR